MVFKNNFRIGLIIRVALLALAIFVTIFSSYKNEWYVTPIVSGAVSLIVTFIIIRYAEKYKRSLSEFLLSIKSRDFISTANPITNKSGDILKEAYRVIINEFQNIRIDKEVQYHYLKTMVEHIKIALLSFNEQGEIQFINKTACALLNLNCKSNVSAIRKFNVSLYNLIMQLKSGENELIKISYNNSLMHLSVYVTELKIYGKSIKLISFQNIKQELEYQELESWQKLIRVLTHEIMNSVTPISSLSTAINETFEETKKQKLNLAQIPDDDFEDIVSSLKTIETRSKGLLKFVSSYKKLTKLPKPDFREVNLVELINHCLTLLKQKLTKENIELYFKPNQENVVTYADYDQIEQVMINLILNAIDAVKGKKNPKITIDMVRNDSNKPKVIIKDNGKGIEPEEAEKIFIPFYTTKKEGSGIGLSLSRQIMRLHKGSIQANSEPGKGSLFTLEF